MTFAGAYPQRYFWEMPAEDACITLMEAKNRRNDELLFLRWVISHYEYECSFEEFKKELKPKPKRSTKEVLAEVDGIIEQFNNGYRKVDIDGNI